MVLRGSPTVTVPPIELVKFRAGGVNGIMKPVSPASNNTVAVPEALVFATVTVAEKRSASVAVPGELEFTLALVRLSPLPVMVVRRCSLEVQTGHCRSW
jgi:hypothetical protein